MSNYSQYFFNSPSKIVELDTVELSHPSFSQVYYLVRNHPLSGGITLTLEDGTHQFFRWYPLKLTQSGSANNLDQTMSISFGDLGQILPQEITRLRADNTVHLVNGRSIPAYAIYPTLIYRTYRMDDTTQPLFGPARFQINAAPRKKDGVTFQVGAPRLNQNATGERYSMTRFAGLRAF